MNILSILTNLGKQVIMWVLVQQAQSLDAQQVALLLYITEKIFPKLIQRAKNQIPANKWDDKEYLIRAYAGQLSARGVLAMIGIIEKEINCETGAQT